MRKYIAVILILLFNYKSLAVDLNSALSSAYDNNDNFQSLRRQFLSDIEEFSQAFSEFLPEASINIGDQDQKIKYTSSTVFNDPTLANEKFIRNRQGTLTISQNVFNGGGSMARLKAAQESFKALRAKYYADEQDIIYGLIQKYLACYSSKEKYEIAETKVKTIKEQLASAEEKLKLGEITTIDLATAKTNLAVAESERLSRHADYQYAKGFFEKDFGIEAVDITLPSAPDNLPSSLDTLIQRAILVYPSVDSARYNVSRTKALELATKSALLPKVDLRIERGRSFFDPQRDADNYVNGLNSKSTTSSVAVRIPIYSKGTEYSGIRKSKHDTRLAVIKLDNVIKQARADSISSWVYYAAGLSKIIAANQAVESSQLAYDGTVQEKIVGTKTILDVLDVTDDLNDAKSRKVDAYSESTMSAYDLKYMMGELTARSLKLKVKYFTPEEAFKSLKKKLFIGF
jgi:outer membrane protein